MLVLRRLKHGTWYWCTRYRSHTGDEGVNVQNIVGEGLNVQGKRSKAVHRNIIDVQLA